MSIRDIFLHNWPQKLISLALAIILFIIVRTPDAEEGRLRLALKLINLPNYLVSVEKDGEKRPIPVRITKKKLAELDASKITVILDMSGAVPGTNEYPFRLEYAGFDDNIQLSSPINTLPVAIDRALERTIPLRAVLRGNPAPGYMIISSNFSPAALLVHGPAHVVNGLESIPLRPLFIDGIQESADFFVEADFSDKNLKAPNSENLKLRLEIGPVARAETNEAAEQDETGESGEAAEQTAAR